MNDNLVFLIFILIGLFIDVMLHFFFIVGIDYEENELGVFDFLHLLVETLDTYFDNVCELDIMFNLDKAHIILDEMISNGYIVETNKKNVMLALHLLDPSSH